MDLWRRCGKWYADLKELDQIMKVINYEATPLNDGRSGYHRMLFQVRLSKRLTEQEIIGAALCGSLYGFMQIRGFNFFHVDDIEVLDGRQMIFSCEALYGEINSYKVEYY